MPGERILYSNPACPFAHRIEALLTVLELPFELRNTGLYLKAPDFRRLSPTGKVPLLVEPDGTVLYESNVIAEYLSEAYDFDGLASDPVLRAQERLAMKQFDAVVLKLLYYRDIRMYPLRLRTGSDRRAVARELDRLEALTALTAPRSLLGLHVAPFWLRFHWLAFLIRAEASIRTRPTLAAWLDEAAALPEVRATANEEAFVGRYRRAKRMLWVSLAFAGGVVVFEEVIRQGWLAP